VSVCLQLHWLPSEWQKISLKLFSSRAKRSLAASFSLSKRHKLYNY